MSIGTRIVKLISTLAPFLGALYVLAVLIVTVTHNSLLSGVLTKIFTEDIRRVHHLRRLRRFLRHARHQAWPFPYRDFHGHRVSIDLII